MNIPLARWSRLVARGGAGLACDKHGVALGAVVLARARMDTGSARRFEVRPAREVRQVLTAAYGPQPDSIVLRFQRGLGRAAASIEAGDLCRAGIEAVLLGLPDLRPDAMAKLNEIADLERVGRHGKTSRAFRPGRQAAVSGPRTAAARRARMSSPPGMSLQRALAPNGATCRSTMGSFDLASIGRC
jgi:hypothetical protein